ncbi:hypothetical protein L0Y65_03170 [Candidatus Micrarchaeota archaeon]|nr:hypothetical protein [Candidatus Micrarchaeota archaeon]
MAFDIGKALKTALIPAVLVIILGIISQGIGFILGIVPFLSVIMCAIGPGIMLLQVICLAWAGFKAVKEAQMDLVGGALSGGIAGVISSVVLGVISAVLAVLGIGANVVGSDSLGGAAIGAGIGIVAIVIGLVVGIIFWTVVGLVMGAIGSFVAGMKK